MNKIKAKTQNDVPTRPDNDQSWKIAILTSISFTTVLTYVKSEHYRMRIGVEALTHQIGQLVRVLTNGWHSNLKRRVNHHH